MASWFYTFSRVLLHQTIRLYYRQIEVVGAEQVPATGPGILVVNHPNSLADAFLLASQLTRRQIHFIAKDSITRAPVVGWLARQFGVVGVARAMDYERQRDLAQERNQAAISTCVPRLRAGELIAIFGEGISTDARRLGMIRKGALRFGYAAERATGFELGLVWIPVGITYSAKEHFRSDVLIRVGEPFDLAALCRRLGLDPTRQEHEILQRGTEKLQRDLEALVVHIEREELAGLVDSLAQLLGSPEASLAIQVERHQRVARAVQYFNLAEPQRLVELEQALRRYQQRLASAGLSDMVARQRHPTAQLWVSFWGLLKSGLLMLLNLYGWANSFLPRLGAHLLAPLGRRRLAPVGSGAAGGKAGVEVAKQATWGTYGGWLGAALGFPLQIYWVYRLTAAGWGFSAGTALAGLYGASLIPSWRLYLRRRDILERHYANFRDALRFLVNAETATRLHAHRRRLQRQLRSLLAAYDAEAPRAA